MRHNVDINNAIVTGDDPYTVYSPNIVTVFPEDVNTGTVNLDPTDQAGITTEHNDLKLKTSEVEISVNEIGILMKTLKAMIELIPQENLEKMIEQNPDLRKVIDIEKIPGEYLIQDL